MPKTIYFDLTDKELISVFKSLLPTERPELKQAFREVYKRDIKFHSDLDPEFCKLSSEILPEILNKSSAVRVNESVLESIVLKNRERILCDKAKDEMQPYLLRKNKEYFGVIRFEKVEKAGNIFKCTIYDFLPFNESGGNLFKSFDVERVCKFNDEKMTMFSILFPANKVDLQEEMATEEDLRLMIVEIAKNGGMAINIEHEPGTTISDNDAIVSQTFQAPVSFVFEGLEVNKGDAVSVVQFFDTPMGRNLFQRAKTEFKSFSMQGESEKVPI